MLITYNAIIARIHHSFINYEITFFCTEKAHYYANVIAINSTNKRIYQFPNENINLQEREVTRVSLTPFARQ